MIPAAPLAVRTTVGPLYEPKPLTTKIPSAVMLVVPLMLKTIPVAVTEPLLWVKPKPVPP